MSGQLKPSPGIVAAAIVAIIGSAFSLLFGLIEIAISFIRLPADVQMPASFMKYSLFFAAVMAFGFGAWGIASGVGLLRLRKWARISTIVYSAILLVFTILPVLIFLLMPFPATTGYPPHGNTSPEVMVHTVRLIMVVIYSIPAGIAIWWLTFFNRAGVKSQFAAAASQVPVSSPLTPAGLPSTLPAFTPAASPRPISISIIGWYLIVAGALMLPFVFFQFPVSLLGWVLTGRRATLIFLVYAVIHLGLGYGLLKLKPLSRMLAICYFLWAIVNALFFTFLPGREARMQASMAAMDAAIPGIRASSSQVAWSANFAHFGLWMGTVFGVLLPAVIVWFLVREKAAFETSRA